MESKKKNYTFVINIFYKLIKNHLTMKTQSILLARRKVLVDLPKESVKRPLTKQFLGTIIKNLSAYGFILSKEVYDALEGCEQTSVSKWYKEVSTILREMVGDNVKHRPMYPNFPEQVMEMDECELYMRAILYYWSGWSENFPEEERGDMSELVDLKPITLATQEDLFVIFTNLASSKTNISETNKLELYWFVDTYQEEILKYMPSDIPLKENKALLFNAFLKNNLPFTSLNIKTATDVLRIAVSMQEGDISLAKTHKFKSFKRKERVLLLELLNNANNIEEDMLRFKSMWLRLGEKLHPGEYGKKFTKAYEAFNKIRNGVKINTYASTLNKEIESMDLEKVLDHLVQRPGEFARKLDFLLRTFVGDEQQILNSFKSIADKVETTVLFQVLGFYKNRNTEFDKRSFFIKGNLAKMYVIDNNLDVLSKKWISQAILIIQEALISKYSSKEPIGKVFVDPLLKQYLIPTSQRSSSKSLVTITRGSKIDFGKKDFLRFFIHWKNMDYSRVDLDLSAWALADDFTSKGQIAYYNLREGYATHSGDITNAPNGASEFIDINIAKALNEGIRYVVMIVNGFTHQPFCNIPECFAGWMVRQDAQKGKIFEAKTVQNKYDLTADTKIGIPVVFDLLERKAIWCDLGLKNYPSFPNNLNNNKYNINLLIQSIVKTQKSTLYNLFMSHALGRGELVDNMDEADVIFSETIGECLPTDIDKIVGQYL